MNQSRDSWLRRTWIALDRYIAEHDRRIRRREGYPVLDDGLSFTTNFGTLLVEGRIKCVHDMFLDVSEFHRVNDKNQIQGLAYSYQACIDTPVGVRHIFRYDNAEQKQREGHQDAFHKHVHDPLSPTERDLRLEWVGEENWPSLADVLDEMLNWWNETGQYLSFE